MRQRSGTSTSTILPSCSAWEDRWSRRMANGLSTPSARSIPRKTNRQSHLWMVKWDGSVHLQLTYGKEGASSPKFSPDGRYISFMSSRPGPAKGDQVWVMDRRGGEAEQLTNITDQNIQGYAWSPESKKLLLSLHPKGGARSKRGQQHATPGKQSLIPIATTSSLGHPGLSAQRRL